MKIIQYGRALFLVASESRANLFHVVDFEPELTDEGKPDPKGEPYKCTCESHVLRGDRPCKHCIACYHYIEPILEHQKHWKHKIEPKPETPQPKGRIYNLRPGRRYQTSK